MEDLTKIFKKDEIFLEKLRNPPNRLNNEENGIVENELVRVEMGEKDYHQVLSVFIKLGAKFDVLSKNGDSLLQIAFKKKYPETIKVLLTQIDSQLPYIKRSIKVSEMFYSEIFLKEEKK